MLQHVETGQMFNFSVFSNGRKPFLIDAAVDDVERVINVLEKIKLIASDPNDIMEIDFSIAFLKSEMGDTQETEMIEENGIFFN